MPGVGRERRQLPEVDGECPLCAGKAEIILPSLEGYQRGASYQILQCGDCGSSYAWPMRTRHDLYQDIYRCARYLEGYNRYYWYYDQIKNQKDPLRFLAEQEECYWFIREYLEQHVQGKQLKILEVGAGLGYLTYALNSAGYDVKGVELSAESVEQASSRFGPYYECRDALSLRDEGQVFDIVILTEVIEHLEQPVAFIENLKKLLSPVGVILVTTPNKGYAQFSGHAWNTDLPPIHLWWFTKCSLRILADHADMAVEFWDFSRWSRYHFPKRLLRKRLDSLRTPSLDEVGRPIRPRATERRAVRWLKRLKSPFYYALYRKRLDLSDASIIGAVFRRAA